MKILSWKRNENGSIYIKVQHGWGLFKRFKTYTLDYIETEFGQMVKFYDIEDFSIVKNWTIARRLSNCYYHYLNNELRYIIYKLENSIDRTRNKEKMK